MKTQIHYLEDNAELASLLQAAFLYKFPELVENVNIKIHGTLLNLEQSLNQDQPEQNTGVMLNRLFPLVPLGAPTDNLTFALNRLQSDFSLKARQILVFTGNTRGLEYVKRQGIAVVSKTDDEFLGKLANWTKELTQRS